MLQKSYVYLCTLCVGQNFKVPLSEAAEDNIEANLLRPAGVMLRPAVFVVRIYKAEELPRSTRPFASDRSCRY